MFQSIAKLIKSVFVSTFFVPVSQLYGNIIMEIMTKFPSEAQCKAEEESIMDIIKARKEKKAALKKAGKKKEAKAIIVWDVEYMINAELGVECLHISNLHVRDYLASVQRTLETDGVAVPTTSGLVRGQKTDFTKLTGISDKTGDEHTISLLTQLIGDRSVVERMLMAKKAEPKTTAPVESPVDLTLENDDDEEV